MPMPRASQPLAPLRERASAGFTFVEVLVAAVISTMLILGVLAVFDTNARISRVQSDVAEMQQAQRISDWTGFLYLGEMIEFDRTEKMFTNPGNKLTEQYITGRFG